MQLHLLPPHILPGHNPGNADGQSGVPLPDASAALVPTPAAQRTVGPRSWLAISFVCLSLLGQGDMLFMMPGERITRIHGPLVTDEEVQRAVLDPPEDIRIQDHLPPEQRRGFQIQDQDVVFRAVCADCRS